MSKIEMAHKVSGLLSKHGYRPDVVCSSAADALSESCRMDDGVIVCGSRLNDMSFIELQDCLPKFFRLIILTKNIMDEEYPESAIKLELPLKISELINAIEGEFGKYYHRPSDNKIVRPTRAAEDRKYIDKAKETLIKKKGMTEPEAYRYIQKSSMDSGTSMVETARMILLLEG